MFCINLHFGTIDFVNRIHPDSEVLQVPLKLAAEVAEAERWQF